MSPPALGVLDLTHLPILLVIGFAIFAGTIGARLFQRLRIPQVVGYIVIGLILGRSGFGLIGEEINEQLMPFSFFALGVIGFMIGGELHRDVFKQHGRQLFAILLSEGLGAFVMVSLLVTAAGMLITGNLPMSIAMGIVLGAIGSATAPAATVNVLWEYKTRGMLTTTVFAIVALDDGLALMLFSLVSSIAGQLTGSSPGGLLTTLGHTAYDILGGIALGAAAGFGLNHVLRWVRDRGKTLAFIIGTLTLVLGIGVFLKVDLILAAMALGMTIVNLSPRRTREAFQAVEGFAPPIYVLFFVLAGARLTVSSMSSWMWAIAAVYVIARTIGKYVGAALGAYWAKAAAAVRKYLGLCLLSQAGVAIGLSIIASVRFTETMDGGIVMGDAIILIVTATTFLVEILGPPFVKVAVSKAGEVGLDVTEADLMREHKVRDMVDRSAPRFTEGTRLASILRTIAEMDAMSYPVTDADGRLKGIISVSDLLKSFRAEGLTDWLVAYDLMQPAPDTITEGEPLEEAVTRMEEIGLDCLPVLAAKDDPRLVGLLERQAVRRKLSQEVLRRHQQADGVAATASPAGQNPQAP